MGDEPRRGAAVAARRRAGRDRAHVLAAADLAAAQNGARAVEPLQAKLNAELRATGDSIFALRVSQLADEGRKANEVAHEIAAELVEALMRLHALKDALFAARNQAMYGKNNGLVEALTTALDALEALKPPQPVGDPFERASIATKIKAGLDA